MERRLDPQPPQPGPAWLRLPLPKLFGVLALLPDEVLQEIEAAYVPSECDCPLEFAPCSCLDAAECDCPARPVPCQHVIEAAGRPWLPAEACAYVLWRLHPGEYSEPMPPDRPSCNTNPEAMVGVYAARAQRQPPRGLRHPCDWIGLGLEQIEPRLARQPIRLRNGADVVGPLRLVTAATEEPRACA